MGRRISRGYRSTVDKPRRDSFESVWLPLWTRRQSIIEADVNLGPIIRWRRVSRILTRRRLARCYAHRAWTTPMTLRQSFYQLPLGEPRREIKQTRIFERTIRGGKKEKYQVFTADAFLPFSLHPFRFSSFFDRPGALVESTKKRFDPHLVISRPTLQRGIVFSLLLD